MLAIIQSMYIVGEKVKEMREKKGWSRQKLSYESGITYPNLSAIEAGRRGKNPSLRIVESLARALDVSADEFMVYEPEANNHVLIDAPAVYDTIDPTMAAIWLNLLQITPPAQRQQVVTYVRDFVDNFILIGDQRDPVKSDPRIGRRKGDKKK